MRSSNQPWKAKPFDDIRLEQNALGEWIMFTNGHEHGIPASDVSVHLWKIIQNQEKTISELKSMLQIS